MKKHTRWIALMLTAALIFALGGCTGSTADTTPSPSSSASAEPTSAPTQPAATAEPEPSSTQQPQEDSVTVRVHMLNGPTGLGAAKLMADAEAGETANRYVFTVGADASAVPALLTSGEVDIAAIPTNVAANLYNKTEGIQMLALNTLGVLYILGNRTPTLSVPVSSLADLAGQTLYATGQGANPEFVLNFLLEQNGLDPAQDVGIVWLPSDELVTKMAGNEIGLCMLPVPAATSVMVKNSDVYTLLDLTEEWNDVVTDGSVLTMGCVVARKDFIQEHPDAVDAFLTEYAASVAYMSDPANLELEGDENPAQLAVRAGIVANAKIAAAALPQANLICITGRDMAASIQGYYGVLWQADPSSIGGGIPDDGLYYVP